MEWVALFVGPGEGCDYTIGCNRMWKSFEADSREDALKNIVQICEDYGGTEMIEGITLLGIDSSEDFMVKEVLAEVIRAKADAEAAIEKSIRRKEYQRLKEEFKGEDEAERQADFHG